MPNNEWSVLNNLSLGIRRTYQGCVFCDAIFDKMNDYVSSYLKDFIEKNPEYKVIEVNLFDANNKKYDCMFRIKHGTTVLTWKLDAFKFEGHLDLYEAHLTKLE